MFPQKKHIHRQVCHISNISIERRQIVVIMHFFTRSTITDVKLTILDQEFEDWGRDNWRTSWQGRSQFLLELSIVILVYHI